MAPFQIHSATMGHGSIGLNGDLGYENRAVTNCPGFEWTISAHANSRLEVLVTESVEIRGFLNGSGLFFAGASFRVSGREIGTVHQPYDVTDSLELPPGTYVFEVVGNGRHDYGHTVWGMNRPGTFKDKPPAYYVTIGAVCKDENHYLVDWVRHHLSIGVAHIYLLDHESSIPLQTTIHEAGLADYVTVE